MPNHTQVPATSNYTSDGALKIDYSDERFVDPEYLEAHRARRLPTEHFGNHTHVLVATNEQVTSIDRGVAELIYAMWRAGIRTDSSCEDVYDEGNPPQVLIGFVEMRDAELFLSLACAEDGIPGSLWDCATGANLVAGQVLADAGVETVREGDDTYLAMGRASGQVIWEWTIFPKVDGRRVRWQLGVCFPQTEVPELASRLRKLA